MSPQVASKKRVQAPVSEKTTLPRAARLDADDEVDLDVSSDIKGIMAALQQVRQKAQSDGLKKHDELLTSASTEIKCILDDAKKRSEKDRQLFFKGVAKTFREYETGLKSELGKYQAFYEKFCKEKDAQLEAYNEVFASLEDTKDKLIKRYEQHRKKEKVALAELQKTCEEKIATIEQAAKKQKQGKNTFSILKKSLGSFLDYSSDEEEQED